MFHGAIQKQAQKWLLFWNSVLSVHASSVRSVLLAKSMILQLGTTQQTTPTPSSVSSLYAGIS